MNAEGQQVWDDKNELFSSPTTVFEILMGHSSREVQKAEGGVRSSKGSAVFTLPPPGSNGVNEGVAKPWDEHQLKKDERNPQRQLRSAWVEGNTEKVTDVSFKDLVIYAHTFLSSSWCYSQETQ